VDNDDQALFRAAVGNARPLPQGLRFVHPHPTPRPIPRQASRDPRESLLDSLSDHVYWADSLESGDELAYQRPGLQNQAMRKLRSGHWVAQAELDLHGLTVAEAKAELLQFLQYCLKNSLRCVRVIHGKGLRSKNHEPVLKNKVAHWLMQREETLAFCQAKAADGGSGAMLVLLRAF
jgi:DNA-nicking Smr family endonuclease